MSEHQRALELAEKVLKERSNEAHLARHIHNLLEHLWMARCETEYYILEKGRADLVCHSRQTLVEVKNPGSLGSVGSSFFDSAFQQLAGYFEGWSQPENWTALLTDGKHWYSWNASQLLTTEEISAETMTNAEQLVAYIEHQGTMSNNTPPPPPPRKTFTKSSRIWSDSSKKTYGKAIGRKKELITR